MKREELENAINNIGDDLIEDAGQIRNKKQGISKWTKALAASAALVIVGAGAFIALKYGSSIAKSTMDSVGYLNSVPDEMNYGSNDMELKLGNEGVSEKEKSASQVERENKSAANYTNYIIGKLIYDDAIYNYTENENSSAVYKIMLSKAAGATYIYRNFLPDGTFTAYFSRIGELKTTALPEKFDTLFKNPVWNEYGNLESFMANIDSVKRADCEQSDEFFYLLTMKNSDLLLCRGFNKDTDEEFIRWIQKLEPHHEELSYPALANSFSCVSKNEKIGISVSDYKKYAVRDAFPRIDVLWKYFGDEEYDLCTYCSLYKQNGDKWEDCHIDTAFNDVLYTLKSGGEIMMQYNLSGVKFEDGAVYRVYLGGFGETDNYVEFTYPVEEIPMIFDESYSAEKADGDIMAKTVSVNTDSQRFIMNLDPLSSYMPVGYYLNDGDFVTFYTDDGKHSLKFRRDGENLIYEGENFQNMKKGDVFSAAGVQISGKELFDFGECASVCFDGYADEKKITDKEKIDEVISLLSSLTYTEKKTRKIFEGGFLITFSTKDGEKHLNVNGDWFYYEGLWYTSDRNISNELYEIKKESEAVCS